MPRHSNGHDEADESGDDELVLDEPRATVLRHLADRDESTTSIRLLAIAIWEHERDCRDASPADLSIEAVQSRLASEHLPALDSEELVDYDRIEGTVALTAAPAVVESYLSESG